MTHIAVCYKSLSPYFHQSSRWNVNGIWGKPNISRYSYRGDIRHHIVRYSYPALCFLRNQFSTIRSDERIIVAGITRIWICLREIKSQAWGQFLKNEVEVKVRTCPLQVNQLKCMVKTPLPPLFFSLDCWLHVVYIPSNVHPPSPTLKSVNSCHRDAHVARLCGLPLSKLFFASRFYK